VKHSLANIETGFELLLESITETERTLRHEAATGILRPGSGLEGIKVLAEEIHRCEKLRDGIKGLLASFRSNGKKRKIIKRQRTMGPVTTALLEQLYLECLGDGKTRDNREVARAIALKIAPIATASDLENCPGTTAPRWQSKLRTAKCHLLAARKIEAIGNRNVRIAR